MEILILIILALFAFIVLPVKLRYIFWMSWCAIFGLQSYLLIPHGTEYIVYTFIHATCLIGWGHLWHRRIFLKGE